MTAAAAEPAERETREADRSGINSVGAAAGTLPPSDVVYQNPGDTGGLMNSTTSYSTDIAPDVIVKAAFDTGWGHYEIYGLGR